MTENSLSITSPGGFLPGITPENLLDARPRCRNALLARALKRTGYAGGSGHGIKTIFLDSMRGGRLWPDYEQSTDGYVRVEILQSKEEYEFFRLVNRYENRLKRLITVPAMTILAVLRNVGPELSLTELTEEMPGRSRRKRFGRRRTRWSPTACSRQGATCAIPVIASQDSKPSRPKLRAE